MFLNNLNPLFFEKTKEGEKVYDISSRLIKDKIIFLNDTITQELATNIASLLFLLDRDNEKENYEKPISLWISSGGGNVDGFFAIYDMMQRVKSDVKTVCIGEACSAAAILLAAGTYGMRYCTQHSRVMIHQIQIDGMSGSNTEIEIDAKEIKAQQKCLTEILARHSGHTMVKIRKDTRFDNYMDAKSAVDYGIVDKILSPTKTIPPLLTREPSKAKKNNRTKSKVKDVSQVHNSDDENK